MLSQYRIQSLRELAESYMPSTCEILRKTRTSDGMGDYTETEAVAATVKCRLKGVSGSEHVIAGQVKAEVSGVVLLPAATDIRATDRLRIEGKTYEVAAVVPRSVDYEAMRAVLVT